MSTTNDDSLHFLFITTNNRLLHFSSIAPTMIRCITFYCHRQMNVAIVTLATKIVPLQDCFDAMEYTTWQYDHIST